jgi:2-polyprenyl-3-methyl-5-hydroxy-6-metoxy-1,4-benzoquinol methylase
MTITDSFQAWTRPLFEADSLRAIGGRLQTGADGAAKFVTQSVEEAALTLELIAPYLDPSKRLLEVGAGSGVLSCFLIRSGFDLVAVDPGGDTFSHNEILFATLAERLSVSPGRIVRKPVEALDPAVIGRFDFIFSNNVLEHVPDFEACLAILSSFLAPGGRMLHNCPNYSVPYEPHYGIPLLPFFPEETARLLPARMRDGGCWRSLNFVTYGRVKRSAGKLGRELHFHRATLFGAFDRMLRTDSFAARHVALDRIGRLLDRAGLLRLLRFVPPSLSTPMVFELR